MSYNRTDVISISYKLSSILRAVIGYKIPRKWLAYWQPNPAVLGIFSIKYTTFSTAEKSDSLLLQHRILATSDSKWRHRERRKEFTVHKGRAWFWIGGRGSPWQRRGPWEPPAPGGGGTPRASPGLRRSSCGHLLPPVLFQHPDRLTSQAVSLESAAQGFPKDLDCFGAHNSIFLLHTLPSGHKEEVSFGSESGGQRPASTVTGKVSLCLSAPRSCPHQAVTQARKDPERALTSPGWRRLLRPPPPRRFSLSVCAPPELRRRLGEEIWDRRDHTQRVQAEASWIQVFTGAPFKSKRDPGSREPGPPLAGEPGAPSPFWKFLGGSWASHRTLSACISGSP